MRGTVDWTIHRSPFLYFIFIFHHLTQGMVDCTIHRSPSFFSSIDRVASREERWIAQSTVLPSFISFLSSYHLTKGTVDCTIRRSRLSRKMMVTMMSFSRIGGMV
jgi:hypothetical protein